MVVWCRQSAATAVPTRWVTKPMANSPGKCVEQFDAEHGKAWLCAFVIAAVTGAFALHGSRPYGPLHLMGIGGGVVSLFFPLAQIVPGSCCLRVCEHGVIIRTLFSRRFIAWESIHDFSVQATAAGDRVALHVDPALGIGRVFPLYFTYRLPAGGLAQRLQRSKPT